MVAQKLNARDMIIQISDNAAVPVWTDIAGLTSFKYDPAKEEKAADTTTFQSAGNFEHEIMQRGAMISLDGWRIADSVTGVQDPGQARVEVQHALLGPASRGSVRFRHILDTTWKVWNATVTLGAQDGKTNDKLGWACGFARCGASTTTAAP